MFNLFYIAFYAITQICDIRRGGYRVSQRYREEGYEKGRHGGRGIWRLRDGGREECRQRDEVIN